MKKEWWTVKAPGMFMNRSFTKSPVNVSAGKKLSSDTIKGRVYESNLGDLHNINNYKKIQLIVDDTASGENKTALTNTWKWLINIEIKSKIRRFVKYK